MVAPSIRVATAGWQIPRAVADRFPAGGSTLERYAAVFDAVEVNTSFYRPHRRAIWERWAAATPPDFRFSAKLSRVVTHERRLVDCAEPVDRFLEETAGLGEKLGAVLIQTPGTLAFEPEVFGRFAELWRDRFAGDTAWEPRHPNWFSPEADAALVAARIARVAADPAPKRIEPAESSQPGGWSDFIYRRLHGSPRIYATPYSDAEISEMASETVAYPIPSWIVFDNTMLGAAAENAILFKMKTHA